MGDTDPEGSVPAATSPAASAPEAVPAPDSVPPPLVAPDHGDGRWFGCRSDYSH